MDASQNDVGGVLMQDLEGYYFKKLLPYQKVYSTIEKEALGFVLNLGNFEIYVKATVHPVHVFTDHNPLIFLHKMKNSNQRLIRWCLILQDYDLEMHNVRGKENVIVDALSHVPYSRETS